MQKLFQHIVLSISLLFFSPALALAQTPNPTTPPPTPPTAHMDSQTSAFLGQNGVGVGNRTYDVRSVVANIIKGLLGIIGTLFIVYAFYGGMMILTSAGDEDKVSVGKSTLRTATLGIMVSLAAYAITSFVTTAVLRSTGAIQDEGGFQYGIDPNYNFNPRNPNNPNTSPSFLQPGAFWQ